MGKSPEELAALRARLQQMQQDYLERMPGELEALRTLAAPLRHGEGDPALLNELRQRLHTLAGSSGTFGQADLGQQARTLEYTLLAWLEAATAGETARHAFLTDLDALPSTLTQLPPPPAFSPPATDAAPPHRDRSPE